MEQPDHTASLPYTALARGYDAVMAHVDYAAWADYAHLLLQAHRSGLETVLELGCGTGSLALALQPRGPYRYGATDASPAMIRAARQKARQDGSPVQFSVADFTDFQTDAPVEAVVLLYDGLNYLLEDARVAALLRCAYDALEPGGLFLFDQSTPANSINNADFFEDAGELDGFAYVRRSRYDAATRHHTTTFHLTVGGQTFCEQHVQRAYMLAEIRAFIEASPFEEVAAFEDFTMHPATEASERIHWLLRHP